MAYRNTVSYRIDPVARCNRLPKMAYLRSTAINIVLTTNMNMTDPKRHSATAPAVGIDGIGPTCQERREVHTLVVALGHVSYKYKYNVCTYVNKDVFKSLNRNEENMAVIFQPEYAFLSPFRSDFLTTQHFGDEMRIIPLFLGKALIDTQGFHWNHWETPRSLCCCPPCLPVSVARNGWLDPELAYLDYLAFLSVGPFGNITLNQSPKYQAEQHIQYRLEKPLRLPVPRPVVGGPPRRMRILRVWKGMNLGFVTPMRKSGQLHWQLQQEACEQAEAKNSNKPWIVAMHLKQIRNMQHRYLQIPIMNIWKGNLSISVYFSPFHVLR